mmetsp:Transcript_158727/g.505297  ORF Transcript_158727/g.505297 Transcript_158727/m.505297 type:complete len:357 (+) Transcript_158727:384-1454(+)
MHKEYVRPIAVKGGVHQHLSRSLLSNTLAGTWWTKAGEVPNMSKRNDSDSDGTACPSCSRLSTCISAMLWRRSAIAPCAWLQPKVCILNSSRVPSKCMHLHPQRRVARLAVKSSSAGCGALRSTPAVQQGQTFTPSDTRWSIHLVQKWCPQDSRCGRSNTPLHAGHPCLCRVATTSASTASRLGSTTTVAVPGDSTGDVAAAAVAVLRNFSMSISGSCHTNKDRRTSSGMSTFAPAPAPALPAAPAAAAWLLADPPPGAASARPPLSVVAAAAPRAALLPAASPSQSASSAAVSASRMAARRSRASTRLTSTILSGSCWAQRATPRRAAASERDLQLIASACPPRGGPRSKGAGAS